MVVQSQNQQKGSVTHTVQFFKDFKQNKATSLFFPADHKSIKTLKFSHVILISTTYVQSLAALMLQISPLWD